MNYTCSYIYQPVSGINLQMFHCRLQHRMNNIITTGNLILILLIDQLNINYLFLFVNIKNSDTFCTSLSQSYSVFLPSVSG